MSDLKMLTKIALLAYGIVNLLFGIMYVLMAETLIASMAPPGWELNVFHPKVLDKPIYRPTVCNYCWIKSTKLLA